LTDYFHIIDHVGKFLNKKGPEGSDTKPFKLFKKYAKNGVCEEDHESGKCVHYDYIPIEDMPQLLFSLFKD